MIGHLGQLLALGLIVWGGLVPAAWAASTTRVSVGPGGVQGNGESFHPALSAGGRFLAFYSGASNLVPDDTNNVPDVFLRDRQAGTTERISVARSGAQGNGLSFRPTITADGNLVAFESEASNLVPGDANGVPDVFLRDRTTGSTFRVSVGQGGAQGNGGSHWPVPSRGGRFVAFASDASNLVLNDTNGTSDIFVRDRVAGTTKRMSIRTGGAQANGYSFDPTISEDGRFVAFYSLASNLVAGDSNGTGDVFVHDRLTGTTERVSIDSRGSQGNSISFRPSLSANGRLVAFFSFASNLVSGDTNGAQDVFVRDRQAGTTERVSVTSGGTQGNGDSDSPKLSADGRFVAFRSSATNLMPGDTNGVDDVFVRDRQTGTTERVSVRSNGGQANGDSTFMVISSGGRFVAFQSAASNLVLGDTNGGWDVFVRDRGPIP